MRILAAVSFAERAHRGQIRRYTAEPYIVHPLEVAATVATVTKDEDVVIAALFHDIVEDTLIGLDIIRRAYGDRVAQLVHEVTDISRPEHGNRAVRKAMDNDHLSMASDAGKTIKLADLISNTQSIVQHDPGFAKVYMTEKSLLLPRLKGGDPRLYARAEALVRSFLYGEGE